LGLSGLLVRGGRGAEGRGGNGKRREGKEEGKWEGFKGKKREGMERERRKCTVPRFHHLLLSNLTTDCRSLS